MHAWVFERNSRVISLKRLTTTNIINPLYPFMIIIFKDFGRWVRNSGITVWHHSWSLCFTFRDGRHVTRKRVRSTPTQPEVTSAASDETLSFATTSRTWRTWRSCCSASGPCSSRWDTTEPDHHTQVKRHNVSSCTASTHSWLFQFRSTFSFQWTLVLVLRMSCCRPSILTFEFTIKNHDILPTWKENKASAVVCFYHEE